MKKIFLILTLVSLIAACGGSDNSKNTSSNTSSTSTLEASTQISSESSVVPTLQVVNLPDPKEQFAKHSNDSLLFALENRRSTREFAQRPLDIGDLSAILWAAVGINRENGNLTIPTSSGKKDMLIYVVKEDGVWLYNSANNTIEQKVQGDIRSSLEPAVAKSAAATLYYVQDMARASNERGGDRHAGSMYQNVGLYCAAAGLNNVVTGSYTKNENIDEMLLLPSDQRIIIAQSIGIRP